MTAAVRKVASLNGWPLLAVFAVVGLISYFVISLVLRLVTWVLHLLTSLEPLVSIVGALAVLAWMWFALQEARTWRPNDWRASSVVERD